MDKLPLMKSMLALTTRTKRSKLIQLERNSMVKTLILKMRLSKTDGVAISAQWVSKLLPSKLPLTSLLAVLGLWEWRSARTWCFQDARALRYMIRNQSHRGI